MAVPCGKDWKNVAAHWEVEWEMTAGARVPELSQWGMEEGAAVRISG